MEINITNQKLEEHISSSLNLNKYYQIKDEELLSNLIRRISAINCPCSKNEIIKETINILKLSSENNLELIEKIQEIVNNIIDLGDLIELTNSITYDDSIKSTYLHIRNPCYFKDKEKNELILLGMNNNGEFPLPINLRERIKFDGIFRRIINFSQEEEKELLHNNIEEILLGQWLKQPKLQKHDELIRNYQNKLIKSHSFDRKDTVEIFLNGPKINVTYYGNRGKGRRKYLDKQTGTFVSRRSAEFGSPFWSYIKCESGKITNLLDLPIKKFLSGADEGLYLLLAHDKLSGNAQKYRIRKNTNRETILDFFSPLPKWAQRYLIIFGRKVPKYKCVFSFSFHNDNFNKVKNFLEKNLWLEEQNE